jgi:1-acyl-sn-glycerol-3-phosphate acyltransferase
MDLVYPPVILSAYGVFRVLNLKFELVGGDHVPRTGGAVLASNHVSYLDFIFCGRACRPSNRLVRFMAKKSTFDNRVSGPLMRSMHHIPVDRSAGAGAYVHAVEWLQRGEVVGVFPEATISQSFELKGFKNGAARMAAESGTPLVPMITFGGQRLWTKGRPRDLERNVVVALTVGKPLHPTPSDDIDEVMAELKSRMAQLLEDTLERYPQRPTEDGVWWWPARLGGGAPTLEAMESRDAARRAERAAKQQPPQDESTDPR